MALTREEVLNVAKLARLEFKEEEIKKFQEDLNDILNYINVLSEVNTENVEPLVHITEEMRVRDDKVRTSLTVEEALKNAPAYEDGAIIVTKVIGE